MMLALANARYHEPLQVFEGAAGNDSMEIASYLTRNIEQLVPQQRNNMQMLVDH